jgi:Domain of unknown function (DUF4124)
MRTKHLILGLATACWCAQAPGAVVYKWKDAAGVVHFSDQPVPGAQRMVIDANLNISHAPPAPAPPKNPVAKKAEALDYTAFSIDAPMANETFTQNSVNVHLILEPALKVNHAISLYLNGKLVENQPTDAVQFTLTDLARGAYLLSAIVADQTTGDSASTDPVTFYVRQASVQSPTHKPK